MAITSTASITTGTLPPGLSISVVNGVAKLIGTPTTAGTYNFTTKLTRSAGIEATKAFTLVVAVPSSDTTLPTGTISAVANSSTQVTVTYSGADNVAVASYTLEYSINNTTWSPLLTNVTTTTPYVHTARTPDTTYYYRLRVKDTNNNVSSDILTNIDTPPDSTLPIANTLNLVANSPSQVTITYSATDNASIDAYYLEWSPNGTSGWQFLVNGNSTATPYIHTGLTPSTVYYYRFRARDTSGNYSSGYQTGNISTLASGAVTASMTATTVSSSSISIAYSASHASGIASQTLEYSLNGTSGWTTLTLTGTPFVHTGLTASTQYYYRYKAIANDTTASAYILDNTITSAASSGGSGNNLTDSSGNFLTDSAGNELIT